MKKFLKTTLAVIVGVIVVNIIGIILFFGVIGSLVSAGDSQPVIPSSGVLCIDMSRIALCEQPVENINSAVSALQSGEEAPAAIGLRDATLALESAATDSGVKYVFLKTDGLSAGMAQLSEFRIAIKKFHDSCGKPVVAYCENPTTGGYYLASVADKIYTSSSEGTNVMMVGVGTQLLFVKDLLDKLGINVQLIRHGKYKSAGEMYIKSAPSPENLEQNTVMIKSIWSAFRAEIAQSRGIEESKLDSLIDDLSLSCGADLVQAGLADGCLSKEELRTKLADLYMADSFSKVKFIGFADYASIVASKQRHAGKNKLAIIYADGEIVDGNGTDNIAGDRFASIIAKVRADSTVKAVVLRVNSPGGSVLASDKIKAELDLLQNVKPLIASYGNYAASGGYWISAGADKIYASPTTLTGSIGVFSMIPDVSGAMKNLAYVNMVSVKSNKHADMLSLTRPLDAQEVAYMQKSVESVYSRFVNIVSEGRAMKPEEVDAIAQGRVWAGADAINIGLVDEFGTLEDAIEYAKFCRADRVPADAWVIEGYPKPLTLMESISQMISGTGAQPDYVLSGTPFEAVERAMVDWKQNLSNKNFTFARMEFIPVFE